MKKSILMFLVMSSVGFAQQNLYEECKMISEMNVLQRLAIFWKCGFRMIDKYDETVVHKALKVGDLRAAGYVLGVDADFNTLFKKLMQDRDLKGIALLLKQNANINAIDEDGNTPLHKAVDVGSVEIIKLLIDHDANINAIDEDGRTPLNAALYEASRCGVLETGKEAVVKLLLDHGANVNIPDLYGSTPLHKAVDVGSVEMIKLLIGHGANVDAMDNYGKTPFGMACPTVIMKRDCSGSPECEAFKSVKRSRV